MLLLDTLGLESIHLSNLGANLLLDGLAIRDLGCLDLRRWDRLGESLGLAMRLLLKGSLLQLQLPLGTYLVFNHVGNSNM